LRIFCGREFWVKVICHKSELFFASLLWKSRLRDGERIMRSFGSPTLLTN
jgi:hypothetical protein